ncbi:hypothetical protein KEU06_13695 [Pseudaminobacter sp. 19-2017]|uniref:Uncharacterized protein n=1 Tax=Pseudaminobacter soli (ex Zhang et al. 2022) TaxID=2831468 RepID=A0A942E272_9HYPH|nr:hypothetical protein [Pseudaminobacter soli]MBS3649661.1 hypothetical protein [Pseudaminobacter soli]
MTSTNLTPKKIELIDWLVQTVSLHGPAPDSSNQMKAAHIAAMRVQRGPISESELRAVIYDALFHAEHA